MREGGLGFLQSSRAFQATGFLAWLYTTYEGEMSNCPDFLVEGRAHIVSLLLPLVGENKQSVIEGAAAAGTAH